MGVTSVHRHKDLLALHLPRPPQASQDSPCVGPHIQHLVSFSLREGVPLPWSLGDSGQSPPLSGILDFTTPYHHGLHLALISLLPSH